MIRRCRSLLLLLCALPVAAADAGVRAFLDRDTVTLGETVTLNVEIDGVAGVEPDLSPLAERFRLLGTSSSSHVSLVNGRQSARRLWAVALEPLQAGTVEIPPLEVGGETTAGLTLTVLPAPVGATASAGDDVFLEVEALPTAPYVQQQVLYTVRLHYALTLLEGQLEEPQPDGARLQRLGSDLSYHRQVGGRRYQVVERRYALVPERSGRLRIGAPRFRGRGLEGARGSFFGGGRPLQAQGNAVELEVKPRPDGVDGPWLPAIDLQLDDESSGWPDTLEVGEPVTLSLRLSARGLMAEQLPELVLPAIEGAQVYPDKESTQTRDGSDGFTAERIRRFAIVPQRAGTLTLPALRIAWWNTATDRPASAELPARTLRVGAATLATADPGESAGPAVAAGPEHGTRRSSPSVSAWPLLSLALLVLWVATLAWGWRRGRGSPTTTVETGPSDVPTSVRSLARALRQGDPRAIAACLRRARGGSAPLDLGSVAESLDSPIQAEATRALERALYRDDGDLPADLIERLRQAFAKGPSWRPPPARPHAPEDIPALFRH